MYICIYIYIYCIYIYIYIYISSSSTVGALSLEVPAARRAEFRGYLAFLVSKGYSWQALSLGIKGFRV